MVNFKVVIGTKSGKCVQKEVADKDAEFFLGKSIGEKFNGEVIGLNGYEFEIKGGSDNCGFPMRWDVQGSQRRAILTTKTIGARSMRFKGQRIRKTMCGNTINDKITQINVKVLKEGPQPLEAKAKEGEKKK